MQVWANCRAYNAEGSDIMRLCKRLEKQLLAAWKEAGLPRKHPKPAAAPDTDAGLAEPSMPAAEEGPRRKKKRAQDAGGAAGTVSGHLVGLGITTLAPRCMSLYSSSTSLHLLTPQPDGSHSCSTCW